MADTQPYARNVESLSADLIAQRGFVTSRRGYDPEEVRAFLGQVAAEVRALRERAANLDAARRDAEERARHPKLDEETILAAVGEETADVLRSAQSAATEIRKRAEEQASALLREAQAQAQALRAEAESTLSRLTADAENQADQIRHVANSDAERTREVARQEAEAVRQQADQERRLTVEAAQNIRERILNDLARRRRVATVQIEQLRAGRERLLDAYLIVRRTLDEVTDELQRADAEARAASDAVGEQLQDEDLLADEPLPEVPPVPEPPTLRPEPPPAGAMSPDTAPHPVVPSPPPSPASPSVSPDDVVVTQASGEVAPTGQEKAPPEMPAPPSPPPPAPPRPASSQQAPAPPSPPVSLPAIENGEQFESVRILPTPVETTPRSGRSRTARRRAPASAGASSEQPTEERPAEKQPAEEQTAEAQTAPSAGDNGTKATPAEGDQVVGLFERLRAEEADRGPEGEKAEDSVPDADELLLQRRDRATGGIEVRLARRLKRALQDEQNDLLDRLRNRKGAPDAARILPSPDEQRQRIANAARPLLEEAVRAGATFARSLFGADGASSAPPVDELPAGLAAAIAEPLREQLERAFHDAGADESDLVESVGAAYREWKTQRIEENAGDHVAAAFSRGAYGAIPDGRTVRWLVEDLGGPCPDCDDNVLAGGQPKGEEFPTGQLYPPAHAGCRCVLVPGES